MIYYCTLLNGHYCDLILALFHHSVTFIGFFPCQIPWTRFVCLNVCAYERERDRDRERESDNVTVFIIRIVNILV